MNGNERSGSGGGVYVAQGAALSLDHSAVTRNEAFSLGGGIANAGIVELRRSTIGDNVVAARGGGIASTPDGSVSLTDSTVSGNQANQGGGINNAGGLTMVDTTVSGNRADFGGGGMINSGRASLSSVTITANEANMDGAGPPGAIGGGIWSLPGGSVLFWDTIVAGNTDHSERTKAGAPDCFGRLQAVHHNLVGNDRGCAVTHVGPILGGGPSGDQIGTDARPIDPRFGPLADNGGPTRTHAPAYGSPAIDVGLPASAGSWFQCKPTDQRGYERPVDGDHDGSARCDLGAYEYGARRSLTADALRPGRLSRDIPGVR